MFNPLKLCVSVVLAGTLAAAVNIDVLGPATAGGVITITWTPDPALDVFSMELYDADNSAPLGIANNVDPSKGKLDVTVPMITPGDGYTVYFVNVTDIDDVYGTSGDFSIAPPVSTSESSTSTGTTSASAASVSTASASAVMSTYASMVSASASKSASVSASASRSAASTAASGAATRNGVHGASAAVIYTGVVLLGLFSAAWIL
ncbi:hypothetical protein C8R47DRAFT_1205807 [Mycena vitilis]|nr:hypothetical protein C8R47DRAFT_1205807 [Mycena vitilis]